MIVKNSHTIKKYIRGLMATLGISMLFSSVPVQASIKEDNIATNQQLETESNQWKNWPEGPTISAESAILMDADTGVILYAKNIHKQQYPASTTKILTTLIAIEKCSMDEMVTFSYKATHDIDPGSNHIGLDEGEQLSMEDCLRAILIRSANEVSFGVAEHIVGDTWENFAPVMNEYAKNLGCLNSNFVNPNGLPNEEHLTTAYDLAMIGRAFFANDILCKMTLTKQLHFYPTETQPDEIWENNQMALLPGKEYAYEYLVGCKTGYTNVARSCLVSCAEKDGMKLICVVLKDEAPYQYEDTISLFNYGFSNFEKRNIEQNESKYNINSNHLFYNDIDIFGNSQALLKMNEQDYIILPKTVPFSDVTSTISYDTGDTSKAALLTYNYHDVYVGSASIDFAIGNNEDYQFESVVDTTTSTEDENMSSNTKEEPSFIFVNLKKILIIIGVIVVLLIIAFLVMLFLREYQINTRRGSRDLNYRYRGSGNYRPSHERLADDLQKKRRQQIAEAKRRQKKSRRR